MTVPPASRASAANCCVAPRAPSDAVTGETTMDVTVVVRSTAREAVPCTSPIAATIVVEPWPVAVAMPLDGPIVATDSSDDVQLKTTPGTIALAASRATAVNCAVAPRDPSKAFGGDTTIDATVGSRFAVRRAVQIGRAHVGTPVTL